jgi:propanol-preferring alcohol dehydrogenase
MMSKTYQAFAVVAPGKFELVERPIEEPGQRQVRIRVEACGVCHSDAATVNGTISGITFPRVPGHEVIGRIDAIGSDVSNWEIGRRVGVGFLAGEDGTCPRCRRGDYVNCAAPVVSGVTTDGGYAEFMIAEARGIVAVPEELDAAEAAPLLCAGLTTFNALRNSNLRSGDLVAVHGIGGLGHLGLQFARTMGFRTVAIARGQGKRSLAEKLGAHEYIDADMGDAADALTKMGGADAILGTATSGAAIAALIPGLAPTGKFLVVSVPDDPIPVSASHLVFGGRSIHGSLTGKVIDGQDTLKFSAMHNVRAMVETMPLSQAPEAYARMMRGEARFRAVLVMENKETM